MKKRKFEIYNDSGKLLKVVERDIRTNWDDLTLKEFIGYLKVVERFEAEKGKYDKGDSIMDEKEYKVAEAVFFADMIMVLTGLPHHLVYTMNIEQMNNLWNEMDFKQSELPKGQRDKFWFRSASLDSIKRKEKKIKDTSFLKWKQKTKEVAELELMKKSHFTLVGDINNMQFRNWIASRNVNKKIHSISGEMKSGNFENYPLLIAYIVKKNNRVMRLKESQKLALVFEDLPFVTAFEIVNFFLGVQTVLSSSIVQYLNQMTSTVKTSHKPTQKKS